MATEPQKNEILEAVKASGYLMEQEVATVFEKLGYHVVTNRAYMDIHESKSREIDVSAIKRLFYDEKLNFSFFVEFICECKNNQNPLVFITRKKNDSDNRLHKNEYVFPNTYYEKVQKEGNSPIIYERSIFQFFGLDKIHYYYNNPYKAVQFCKIVKDKNSWKANHDGIYDAILLPIIKALISRKNDIKKTKSLWFFFPLVITNGELYTINSMFEDSEPEQVKLVSFKREIKEEKIEGNFMVDFVQKVYLAKFLSEHVEPLLETVLRICQKDPESFTRDIIKDIR